MRPDEKKHVEAYHLLERLLESVHVDNMKVLKALISHKDDFPLVDGLTKKRVRIEVYYIIFSTFFILVKIPLSHLVSSYHHTQVDGLSYG